MGDMQGMTISEMAKILDIPKDTVKMRLNRAGCKPFCQEALYTKDDLEKIKDIKMGRPPKKDKTPKKPAPEPTKPPAPKAKSKK